MGRISRPWYFTEKKAYAATVKGRRVILVKAEESDANFRLAQKKLRQVLKGTQKDPMAGGLDAAQVIDRYLALTKERYSERAFAERCRYLQAFAEAYGFRKVNDRDCLPVHIEEWLAAHPDWASEWTRGHVISILMRPFNWAAKKRLIPSNPFRGVEKTQGEPRRQDCSLISRPRDDRSFRNGLRPKTGVARRTEARKT